MNANGINPETLLSDIWAEHCKCLNDGVKPMNDLFNKKIKDDQEKITQIKSDIENEKINPLKGRLAITMIEQYIEIVQNHINFTRKMMDVTNSFSPKMELNFAVTDRAINQFTMN